jgi:hypothetical protein
MHGSEEKIKGHYVRAHNGRFYVWTPDARLYRFFKENEENEKKKEGRHYVEAH